MPTEDAPGLLAPAVRAALTLAMLGAACGSAGASASDVDTSNESLLVSGSQNLPADARAVIERLAACTHFMGEFSGDGSERDREINAIQAELRCDRIEADADGIQKKYRHDAVVQGALTDAARL